MARLKEGMTIELEDVNTGEVVKGKVTKRLNKNQVVIETPDGKEQVVDLLKFIVTIIPLVNIIIDWVKGLFKRKSS